MRIHSRRTKGVCACFRGQAVTAEEKRGSGMAAPVDESKYVSWHDKKRKALAEAGLPEDKMYMIEGGTWWRAPCRAYGSARDTPVALCTRVLCSGGLRSRTPTPT
jgi:hypothetical protein